MPPPTQTRRISISVDTSGSAELKALANQLGDMNQRTKTLADGMNSLQRGVAALIGGLTIRELVSFSDEIQTLNNRLLAITGNQTEATVLMGKLAEASRDTNTSLKETVDVYTRVGLALKSANISSDTTLEFTKTLVNTFRLSGRSAEEAASAVTSLAYGFQLGELRGRELRTVLRQNAVLADLLKKNFGGNLLSAANDGFITTGKLMEIVLKNMDQINGRAEQLQATFGQSITKVLDAFKIKIFEVSQSLDGPGSFATAADAAVKHMDGLVGAIGILATVSIPLLLIKLGALALALSPITLIIAAIEGITAAIIALEIHFLGNYDTVKGTIAQLKAGFHEFEGAIDNLIAKGYDFLALLGKFAPEGSAASNARAGYLKLAEAAREAAKEQHAQAQILLLTYEIEEKTKALREKSANDEQRRQKDIQNVKDKIQPDLTPQQLLADLNRQYREGTITITEYNSKLQEVHLTSASKEFRDGKIDLEKYNEAFDANKIFQYNIALEKGKTTFADYDKEVRNVGLDKLNRELESGKISLEDYNSKLASVSAEFSTSGAFRTGLQEYVTAIGSTTQQVAGAIKTTFSNLETALFDFVKKGTFNFNQFTQAVLDDLLKIIIRSQIIGPLAQGLLGVLPTSKVSTGPSTNVGPPSLNAHGNIYDRGLVKFAAGGIVTGPTGFGYGNGQSGLMGEAGPEAILPLKRDSSGDLGVSASLNPVTINIINQNGSDVQQSETTGPDGSKQIDIMITTKVSQGIAAGKYDKAFKSAYGLQRKGS